MRNIVDRALCLAGLIALAPVLAVIAALVHREDRGPVLFRQVRVGRGGRPFQLLKFRSMRVSEDGPAITASGDRRITRIGKILRNYKLDELPQLWNVVGGDMNLVGPRPEVAKYVDSASATWRRVLSVRPGITDLATLVYRNEEELLGRSNDPELFYREIVLPQKLQLNIQYLEHSTFVTDCKLVLLTLRYSLRPQGFDAEAVKKTLVT